MSNYVKAVDFESKDSLVTGNPLKIIKGVEINDEFNAIQTAVATKADLASPNFLGNPTATTQNQGDSSTRLATTAFVTQNSVPQGAILLWSGSVGTIPNGWLLCDGNGGTPDLRNRFVVGATSTYAVGATGGSADAIVVSHTHTATSVVTDNGHSHGIPSIGYAPTYGWGEMINNASNAQQSLTATTGITVATTNSTTGSSGTNANLPPYYALCYIMKT
jgi:hypothetical protein